ncbi:DUF4214 domain-containing protein [Bacteriovorax sp. PP10]|uniref:DUF4214 domain-containing protein n=1 Tax=Bacteriovorax antarcticus TaxID=3088717 RepID=A0ABU5VSX0_9BACT|nr:DUF4214 domain-containing protein [Bacteriovorax sp. PP10]MEA9356022.1 DUF4214 domain-containing protein [Bacteriovorax sp. PP10]
MTFKNNSSGFTLAEVVIAMGISSVVILGAGGFLKTSFDSSVSTNKRIDKNEYFDEMSKTISNRLTCGETLKNLSVGSSVTGIKKQGQNIFAVGQSLAKDTTLSSITLEQNPNWTPVAEKYGPARLKIQVAANGVTTTKYFPISIQLDKDKKVIGCSQKLELGSVKEDIYNEVCTTVVGGSLNSKKCNWTKPIHYDYVYIPAPPPAPVGPECYGPICAMYASELGRMPDAGGKAYWEAQVASGASLAEISAGIANSKEANGIAWGVPEWDYYARDVASRGMTFDYAVKQCGVDMSC